MCEIFSIKEAISDPFLFLDFETMKIALLVQKEPDVDVYTSEMINVEYTNLLG